MMNPTTRSRRLTPLLGAVAMLTLAACASNGAAPVGEMATARASILQAESAGATQTAPVELLASREKMARAESALREERFSDARRLAEQATVDAELAERKARAGKSRAAALALERSNATLEAELAARRPAR